MTKVKPFLLPVLSAAIYLGVMAFVETVWMPGSLFKSLVKLILTAALVGIACAVQKKTPQEIVFLRQMKPRKCCFWSWASCSRGCFWDSSC